MRRAAFTLAEVLITLGIIGVVAAMTLPSLIKKHQEIVTVNKVKKVYSVLNQAFLMARKDFGDADCWSYADAGGDTSSGGGGTKAASRVFAAHFIPYLRIIKDCGTDMQCLAPGKIKFLNGVEFGAGDFNMREHYKFILEDGTYIWMRNNYANCIHSNGADKNVCAQVLFDVNGKNKPNQLGVDIFTFNVTKNQIIPFSSADVSEDNDCKKGGEGWSCAAYILKHDNMKYYYK